MNNLKLSALLILLIITLTTKASPADPSQRRMIKLNDGTKKMVRLIGDEHGHYWKALDNSGCYRRIQGVTNQYMEVSEADERRKAEAKRVEAQKKAERVTRSPMGFPCTKQNLIGKKRMLVILVSFNDRAFSAENARIYNDIFNTTNYHEGRFTGSVRDYFLAQSNHQLEIDFDIVGPVKVSRNSAYYGEQTNTKTNAHPVEMVAEAIKLVDNMVDFSLYDCDNDGIVEQIAVIYAGLDQAAGGTEDDIWAHQGSVMVCCDHKIIKNYACTSENRLVGGEICLNGIGMICHEISHSFGLADTYDVSTGSYGTKRWDIMGIGVHNNSSFTPAGFSAFGKMFCLWQSPVILRDSQRITDMRPLSEGGNFYLIPNDAWDDEFFLLENRQQTGWDAKLPGHGMLITHVDYEETLYDKNIVNKIGKIGNYTNDHERISVVLADNDATEDESDYDTWLKCMQGDLYPYGNNNSLTNTTTPEAKLYHRNIDESFLLSKPVTDIKENSDGTMEFLFTNDIAAQIYCHLTNISGKIRITSETEAQLLATIKNNGNVDYSGNIGAFVYTKENGKYIIQEPREIQMVSLAAGETKECVFSLDNLIDNTNYYIFLNYLKKEDSTEWTQMGNAYPINLKERNTFTISMDAESMETQKSGNSVIVTATFHNDNYRTYTNDIGLYTYLLTDGKYKLQKPSAVVTANIEPFGEQRLSFKLENMNRETVYSAIFYYISNDPNKWTQLSGPHLINPKSVSLLGDANDDHVINITDVIVIVNYILGRTNDNFIFTNSDLDKNGIVEITDALRVVNIILGRL